MHDGTCGGRAWPPVAASDGECIGIEGMPEEEALDLIAELDAHCVRPEFCYRHSWRVVDLVM